MSHIYRYAARYIAGLALLSFMLFGLGAWKTAFQPALFKGAELVMYSAGLFSILLLRRQLWAQEQQNAQALQKQIDDHRWNTYCTFHQHFPTVPPMDIRDSAYELAQNKGFINHFNDRGTPITDVIKAEILAEPQAWKVFRGYLDCFEEFCAAINIGLVDDGYAMSIQGTRVVRNFTVFEPLIRHYQSTSPTAYIELTKVALRWRMTLNVSEIPSVGIGNNGTSRFTGPQQAQM